MGCMPVGGTLEGELDPDGTGDKAGATSFRPVLAGPWAFTSPEACHAYLSCQTSNCLADNQLGDVRKRRMATMQQLTCLSETFSPSPHRCKAALSNGISSAGLAANITPFKLASARKDFASRRQCSSCTKPIAKDSLALYDLKLDRRSDSDVKRCVPGGGRHGRRAQVFPVAKLSQIILMSTLLRWYSWSETLRADHKTVVSVPKRAPTLGTRTQEVQVSDSASTSL